MSHPEFKKSDLDTRQQLYRKICEQIWSPARFEQIAKAQIQLPQQGSPIEQPSEPGQAVDLATGGYKENSVVYDLYRRLSDGNWHSLKDLEKMAGEVNFEGRLARIRGRGKRTAQWTLEEKDSKVRLRFAEQSTAVEAKA